eukprot:CCRYP_008072-RA/>CCRYP_008072-RA protein AED:0.45 eAED:1.00 QI:0/0/0/1/0/0/2/0/248
MKVSSRSIGPTFGNGLETNSSLFPFFFCHSRHRLRSRSKIVMERITIRNAVMRRISLRIFCPLRRCQIRRPHRLLRLQSLPSRRRIPRIRFRSGHPPPIHAGNHRPQTARGSHRPGQLGLDGIQLSQSTPKLILKLFQLMIRRKSIGAQSRSLEQAHDAAHLSPQCVGDEGEVFATDEDDSDSGQECDFAEGHVEHCYCTAWRLLETVVCRYNSHTIILLGLQLLQPRTIEPRATENQQWSRLGPASL